MKGLFVFVYRNSLGDCTAGGITSEKTELKLVDSTSNGEIGPFEIKQDEVYLKLIRRNIGGREHLHAEPYKNGFRLEPNKICGFGGNFIYTSDSRFPNKYPIAVHDRFESQETYNALSQ